MAAALGVFLCAMLADWYNRRRSARGSVQLEQGSAFADRSEPAELGDDETRCAHEKDGNAIIGELSTRANTHELLGTSGPVSELEEG